MTMWSVLGVERHADRATIRRAYARKLRETHPEDDPEGFKALRKAYEMALADADWRATWSDYGDDEEKIVADALADAPVPKGDVGSDKDVQSELGRQPPPTAWDRPAPPDDADAHDEITRIIAGRDAELDQLRRDMAALEAGLRGPWRASDVALVAAFEAILASPALGEIGVREDIEAWLADLLAETIPHSDAILQQAIVAFGWGEDRRIHHPGIAAVLERHDEWRIIAALNKFGHDYHGGWRSLTRKPGNPFLWRINALRPKVTRGAAALLGESGPVSPGLHHSFDSASVERWRAFLAEPRLTLGMLAQAPLLFASLLWVHHAVFGYDTDGLAVVIAALLACTAPVATLFALAPIRERLRARIAMPRWQAEGWPYAYAVTLLLAMVLPGNWPVIIAPPAIGVAIWAFLVSGAAPAEPRPLAAGALLYAGFFLFGGAALDLLTPAQGVAVAIAAVTLAYLRLAHWPRIDAILTALLGPPREWLILAAALVALGLAGLVMAWRMTWAPAVAFYPFALAILAVAPLVGATSRSSGPPRWMTIAILSFAFVLAMGASAPAEPAPTHAPGTSDVPLMPYPVRRDTLLDARDADHGLAMLAASQPAFAQVKDGNPAFYATLRDTLQPFYDGKSTRPATMTAFDTTIDTEYRRRLPQADAGLLIEGQRIRLSVLRTLADGHAAACADEADTPIDPALLTPSQRDRRAAQVFNVISNPPASAARLAAERPIAIPKLMTDTATRLKITPAQLAARLEGKGGEARQCAARIALLTTLTEQPNGADIAATVRAPLRAAASGKAR